MPSIIFLLSAVATALATWALLHRRTRESRSPAESETTRGDREPERVREQEDRELHDSRQKPQGEDLHGVVNSEKVALEEEPQSPEQEIGSLEQAIPPSQETPRHNGEQGGGLAVETQGTPVEPAKRGGRPRGSIQDFETQPLTETQSRGPKPEITCYKREREWIPVVEVPENFLGTSSFTVLQGASPLRQDESAEGCWRLERAGIQVVVRSTEEGVCREAEIALNEENYLLFKLYGQNQNHGRRVKRPSVGCFLVVVPEDWERNEDLAGPPPVSPEPVSLTGYQAHFFVLDKEDGRRIAFFRPASGPFEIESEASRFELVGTQLNDASEGIGPLFGVEPPRIGALDEQTWRSVGTIVVGEEGSGGGRWRKSFSPVSARIEQNLPNEIADRKAGRYFLRIYDTKDDFVESLDFRFLSSLRRMTLPQSTPLPSETGHTPACVEFLHDRHCTIQAADEGARSVQICRESERTVLTVPRDPSCDLTRWHVGLEGGPKTEVSVLVERVWWTLREENAAGPSDFKDEVITLSRESFAATSRKTLWLRFPRRRWVDTVLVGFDQSSVRPYIPKVMEKTLAIPLRDLVDVQQVSTVGVVPFRLWIYPQGTTYTGVLGQLTVMAACKFCPCSISDEQRMFSHLQSLHMDEFFPELTYDEYRHRIPSLPHGIYKCAYCPRFVKADDPFNPTSTIIRHIEQHCPNARRGSGPVQIRFRTILDVEEIRQNVIRNLPRIHRCRRCDLRLQEAAQEDKMQHLVNHHRGTLYELR